MGGNLAKRIRTLVKRAVSAIRLKILVFGPQVHTPSTDPRTSRLQAKRKEIRAELEKGHHTVRYAEDLVDPSITGPLGNMLFQELLIMQEYDLIVVIVDSPGSITEATAISLKPTLAEKSSLFLDAAYTTGLVAETCRNARDCGAHYQEYQFPRDLDACHLLTHVMTRAELVQKTKLLL